MKRRTIAVALLCTGITTGSVANAQQRGPVPRIGLIGASTPLATWQKAPTSQGFLKGLHELGYEEGRNIIIESHSLAISGTAQCSDASDEHDPHRGRSL